MTIGVIVLDVVDFVLDMIFAKDLNDRGHGRWSTLLIVFSVFSMIVGL